MAISNVASGAREVSTDRMSHSGASLESGLSRSQSGGMGGVSGADFSRSHSKASGGDSKDLRYHSSTSRGTLESNLSRSPSSRSGNFADIENNTESSVSKSPGRESFSRPGTYRSSGSRDELEGGLSRSTSRGTIDGSFSRSQSNRSGGLTDSIFIRTPSASEAVSEGSLSRSHSGMSTSFVAGGLSRNQSRENEGSARVLRTNSAEDGGVPVGGILRNSSRESSESRLARSRSDKKEVLSGHESEGYVEPAVSRTNSAEDGGVPVGGISRSHSETSRYRSEGNYSRSQSDGAGSRSSCRQEGYVEPNVSRTNSAEDGGVPVGGIPKSQTEVNRYSPDRSLPRLHSGDDEARSNPKKEAYAEPSRTGSAGDDVGISRRHSGARSDLSAASLSGSLRDQSEEALDTALPRAHSEGAQEGSDNNATSVESGVSRSHGDGVRVISVGSGFRTPSVTSTALTDSVFTATPGTADENIYQEILSRVPSGAAESVSEANLSVSRSGDSEGPVETSTPIYYSCQQGDTMQRSISRSHSGESRSFRTADSYRSPSEASIGVSEGKLSRSTSYLTAVSHPDVSRTYSGEAESPSGGIEAPVGSPRDGSETVPQRGLGASYSREESLSRTPVGESAGPGATYLVDEVRSDYQSPVVEASYYEEFSHNN